VGGAVGTDGFVAEIGNFLAAGIADEQLGGKESLAVGQVDDVPAVQSLTQASRSAGRARGEGLNQPGLARYIPERALQTPEWTP
jgi:hypothetical protein